MQRAALTLDFVPLPDSKTGAPKPEYFTEEEIERRLGVFVIFT